MCSHKVRRSLFMAGLFGTVLCFSGMAEAQSVKYTGSSPALDFGNVNVCPAGATTPAPCSKKLTLTYQVTSSGTLGTPKVVTGGVVGLDFTLSSSTCTGAVSEGNTCTVSATFTPRFTGSRPGAVLITDGSGAVLTTTLIYGLGIGPQLVFSPGTLVAVPCSICEGP